MAKTDSTGTYTSLCDGTSPGSSLLSDGAAVYTPGLSERCGGASTFRSNDKQGNLWTLNGANGGQSLYQDTTAFGALTAAAYSSLTPFKFGGGNGCQSDIDTGLVLMGHRYYDCRLGRFITQDPIHSGNNWYAYCGNNPVNDIDPSGLEKLSEDQLLQMMHADTSWNGGDYSFGKTGSLSYTTNDGSTNTISGHSGDIPAGSGTSDAGMGFGGFVDNWVTLGTVAHAAKVAGDYDSGKASRGAAIGAGALAVGAIVAAAATDGEDAAAVDAEKVLTRELIQGARRIEPFRDAALKAAKYGGKAKNWRKLSTRVFDHPLTGERVEIHWIENMAEGIGRWEIKWKLNPFE